MTTAQCQNFEGDDLVETDATKTFRSHASYLRAFALIVRGDPRADDATALGRIAREVAAAAWTQSRPSADEVALRGCLTRAWSTEVLIAVGRRVAGEDELLRLTNSWAVVQAYYAAYSATQALLVAEGKTRPTSHAKTQRQAVDLWVHRAASVAPWSFAIAAPGTQRAASDGSINGPGRSLDEVHPWSACTERTCWDIAGLALRTTRDDAVAEGLIQARQRKLRERIRLFRDSQDQRRAAGKRVAKEPAWPSTANLSAAESAEVKSRIRPYTLLDYLYRVRVKTNYEDATVFIDGPDDDRVSAEVAEGLELLTAATLLAHELRIGQQIGRERLLAIADSWLAGAGGRGDGVALSARREVLERLL